MSDIRVNEQMLYFAENIGLQFFVCDLLLRSRRRCLQPSPNIFNLLMFSVSARIIQNEWMHRMHGEILNILAQISPFRILF